MVRTIEDVTFINVTPHPVTLQYPDGRAVSIPPSGYLVNARPIEAPAGAFCGAALVKTRFAPDAASLAALDRLEETDAAQDERQIVLGSIIAAQAYPGRVLAMVPVPGFERVPPAEKRMRADKFTVF